MKIMRGSGEEFALTLALDGRGSDKPQGLRKKRQGKPRETKGFGGPVGQSPLALAERKKFEEVLPAYCKDVLGDACL